MSPRSLPPTRPAEGWRPDLDLNHERLVWLAARGEVERRSNRWWQRLAYGGSARAEVINTMITGRHVDVGGAQVDRSDRAKLYAVVVDYLAAHFDRNERVILKDTGVLPRWFWPAATEEFKRRWPSFVKG